MPLELLRKIVTRAEQFAEFISWHNRDLDRLNLWSGRAELKQFTQVIDNDGGYQNETYPLGVVPYAGRILRILAGSRLVAGGTWTLTIDVLKNGTSLVAANGLVLDSGNTARTIEEATLTSTLTDLELEQDDWLDVTTVVGGSGDLGPPFDGLVVVEWIPKIE